MPTSISESLLEYGLWYSPRVKIYTLGGSRRVAEISNYPRAYKDTSPHLRTEDLSFVVGAEDLPHPVKRLFKTYPTLDDSMPGITTQGHCNGCTMCTQLWSAVRNAGYPPAEINDVTTHVIQTAGHGMGPESGPRRWGIPGLIPVECDYELYLDGVWVKPVIAETELSPGGYVPIDEQFYTDSKGIESHVGEIATLYVGDPAPGAFPKWIESETIPSSVSSTGAHEFSILDIPGPLTRLSAAQQKKAGDFEDLSAGTVDSMKNELHTGKVHIPREPSDPDKQVIRILYQRMF